MKINRQELLKVLNLVKPGLAKKELVAQAVHFVFTGQDVCTYNGNICIVHPFPTDFNFSVKGEEFFKLISGISDDEITIEKDKKGNVQISSNNTKAGMSTIVAEEGRVDKEIEKVKADIGEWEELSEGFKEGIFLTMFSAAKDLSMQQWANLSVHGECILASDGSKRASIYSMKKPMPIFLFLARDAFELVKFPITYYCLKDNWVHFATDEEVTFSCLQRKDKYPDIRGMFKDFKGVKVQLPDTLKAAIDAIQFLSEGEMIAEKRCEVAIEAGKIECTAEKEVGWVSKTVPFPEYAGEPLEFVVNPVWFSQAMDKATSMQYNPDNSRILFTNESFMHMMALPRKKKEVAQA